MIYLSIAFATIIIMFVISLHHSIHQEKRIKNKDKQIAELTNNYNTLYSNVENTYGHCAAIRMARKQSDSNLMYKLDPTTRVPKKKTKSIEII